MINLGNHYNVGFFLMLFSILVSVPIYAVQAEPDFDGDGIPDNQDLCPNLKEDYEEVKKGDQGVLDGCPSNFVPWYDEDYDGIEDYRDQCPTVKEIYNGFEDNDGCPDHVPAGGDANLDSDNDSIIDALDLCPNQPENYNGILDTDGCPENIEFSILDTDGDGIPDHIDSCPLKYLLFHHHQNPSF